MDQYASEDPWNRRAQTEPASDTPIYDRLLAQWRMAGLEPEPAPPGEHVPARPRCFVPAARNSAEAVGG
ncbi:hypothetical protein ABZ371_20515 [Streptomyces sp. NPDC005899]|uniref:hypothetical protein n=1 Tax=Streptomyces sp. NPDC005899 TaxID=3155716 RepID=UPI0033E9A608